MNRIIVTVICKGLVILLLNVPQALQAAAGDDYIRGYASAVLEREFRLKNFSLDVAGETVRIASTEIPAADHEKLMAALLSIAGIKSVEIVDGGTVVASATAPEPGPLEVAAKAPIEPQFELGFLPGATLFDPLIADPRWPRFSMGYRYFPGKQNVSSVGSATFGETIALYRDQGPRGAYWEVGLQAGVFSIFDLEAPSSDLVNTDFFVGLQASYRMDEVSTQLRIFHQSSHLGDEFILRNRIDRINLSFEGLDLKLSYRPFDWLRLYGGAGYLFNRDPSDLKPWGTQGGIELRTPWRFWRDSTRLVTALDIQNWEEQRWSTSFSLRSGLQFERPQSFLRRISLLFEYYKGHSPNGQFFKDKIEYLGPGLYLDF